MPTLELYISNLISRIFGKFANTKFPPKIQHCINKTYVKAFKISLSEFDRVQDYASLNELFTRKLRHKRVFTKDKTAFISPSDSKISAIGDLKDDIALQIKGMYYSVNELLTGFDEMEKNIIKDGKFITFYLSPKDYHRYHAPIEMKITKIVHIPGFLLPVNKPSLLKNCNLFVKNERVVCKCEDEQKNTFYLIFVGALNVGKIIINGLPELSSNTTKEMMSYSKELLFKKGDEIGRFEMGSTIVALFPKEYIDFDIKLNDKVKFGQSIARRIDDKR